MLSKISTQKAPSAIGPYSQGIAAGGYVFVSGQIPVNPENTAVPSGIDEQARQALDNLRAVLEAAGSSLAKVVKTTIYLKNMNDFAAVNAIYAGYFSSPCPARSCVEVSRLPKDVLIEVEAIALAN